MDIAFRNIVVIPNNEAYRYLLLKAAPDPTSVRPLSETVLHSHILCFCPSLIE